MSIRTPDKRVAPALQVLLGGGNKGNGQGVFADKVVRIPSRRGPEALRRILNDFEENGEGEKFADYYSEKGEQYFYQILKDRSDVKDLTAADFIDWGNTEAYIPNAQVKMVAPFSQEETQALASKNNIPILLNSYAPKYLDGQHIVIATTDVPAVNVQVYNDCKEKNILVNVADNPLYCDFYMGGIVTKGNVKLAISTNGKSPTIAKRFRQFFEDIIPGNIDELVKNINKYRNTLKGDFEYKVDTLYEFTKGIVENNRRS